MILTSTLSNFFSNLKNHSLSKKTILKQQKTKQIIQLVHLLVNEGYIKGYYLSEKNMIHIMLKYNQDQGVIHQIQQISTPGKRIYIKNKWLYKNNTPNLYIISTSKGFVTQNQALKLNLGGELICKIN